MDVLSQADGIKLLAKLICERNIIPVFGAGFTMKSRAYKGQVPDGALATKMMKKLLLEHCDKIKESDVQDMDFNETSEMFIDLVPIDVRTEFLEIILLKYNSGRIKKNYYNSIDHMHIPLILMMELKIQHFLNLFFRTKILMRLIPL